MAMKPCTSLSWALMADGSKSRSGVPGWMNMLKEDMPHTGNIRVIKHRKANLINGSRRSGKCLKILIMIP